MPGIDESKCVLVTGATAGIGRALALAIQSLPAHPVVIAAGRRQDRLEELTKSNLETVQIDLDTNHATLKKFADDILHKYPDLDTIVLCAGVQHQFDFKKEVDLDSKSPLYTDLINMKSFAEVSSEINMNYVSIVCLVSFFIPHLLRLAAQGRPCFIVLVSSGLGIVPVPSVLNYSASKAALRSFSTSLRIQLHGTNVHVLEVIPPLVESELHDAYGSTQKLSKFWMPLDEYTKITLEGLRKGDPHIITGGAADAFKRFETGKFELSEGLHRHFESVLQ